LTPRVIAPEVHAQPGKQPGASGGTVNNNVSLSITFSPAEKQEMAGMTDAQLARKLIRVVRDNPRLVKEMMAGA